MSRARNADEAFGNDGDADLTQEQKRRKEIQEGISDQIKRMSSEEAMALLDDLVDGWELRDSHTPLEQVVACAFRNFEVDLNDNLLAALDDQDPPTARNANKNGVYGLRDLDDRIGEKEVQAVALYHRLRELKEDDKALDLAFRVLECIFYARRIVMCAVQSKLAVHQLDAGNMVPELAKDVDARLSGFAVRFRWMDVESLSPWQKLLLYLLDVAYVSRYRKRCDMCYEAIQLADGQRLHAWKPVCKIQQFVNRSVRMDSNLDQWLNATSSGNKNVRDAIEYLTNCVDYQFPSLEKTRGVYSFRNGVYVAGEDSFRPTCEVPDTVVSCKFFDTDLTHVATPWRDIPTPHLDSILNHQRFEPDVKRWVYIMLGRLLYPVGHKDNWQIIMYLFGAAGTGKSTILNDVAAKFYETEDVGQLSSNCEQTFALSAFADKFLFLAPELTTSLRLSQAELQQIISGEETTINRKFQTASSGRWTVPGALAGNQLPSWHDNAGSMQRRILLLAFEYVVTNGDTYLAQKLAKEMPRILLKCNRAYLEAIAEYGHQDVWSVLPPYFKQTRSEMAQTTNALEAFLASTSVRLGADERVPFNEFKKRLKQYETDNGYPSQRKTADYFRVVFLRYNIKHEKTHAAAKGDVLEGVSLVDEYGGGEFGLDWICTDFFVTTTVAVAAPWTARRTRASSSARTR